MPDMPSVIHAKVSKVCPIHGISFGDINNKATWQTFYKISATAGERQAASDLITAIDVSAVANSIEVKAPEPNSLPYFDDTSLKGVVCFGDSLTDGYKLDNSEYYSYPAYLYRMQDVNTKWAIKKLGYPGLRTDQLNALYAGTIAPLYNAARPKNVLVYWGINNDLFWQKTQQFMQDQITAAITAAHNTGFKIVIVTAVPSTLDISPAETTPPTYESSRQLINTWVVNNSAGADAVAHVGGDTEIGNVANTAKNTIDGIHFIPYAYNRAAIIIRNAILTAMT